MTTSGETAWSLTARDICTRAMEELGVLSVGGTPKARELEACLVRLNGMLKSWQGKANLFRETTGEATIAAGVGTMTLPEGVRDVSSVRVVVSATQERQLWPWQRSQYLSLPNKAAVGAPTAYYLSRQRDTVELSVWPVPATDMDIRFDYSRIADTITNATETLDIPAEWHETVYLGLASRIAGMFGASRMDPANVADVKQRAEILYQQMLDQDRPDSYYFEAYGDCG